MKSKILILLTAVLGAASANIIFEENFPDSKYKAIDFFSAILEAGILFLL